MGEQHFPKIPVQLFPAVVYVCFHVFKGKSLQFLYRIHFLCLKGHQGRGQVCNLMAAFPGPSIAIARGSGGRIGQAACGHDHAVPVPHAAAHADSPAHTVFYHQALHLMVQMDFHPLLP